MNKQEDKELLLKDLCARLPYDPFVKVGLNPNPFLISYRLTWTLQYGNNKTIEDLLESLKPYLRPMSSMTDEEKKEFCKIEGRIAQYFPCKHIKLVFSVDELDWLNAHHFDYRGLIEKGLALEAPEEMYNVK